uniref:Uncharacterized protein n=1 Tax=Salmo trutta TaxID=8032 RepID=A0A674BFQ2_SALTR
MEALNKCLFLCFTGEKHDPSYYTLNSSNTTACLATDFSSYKANSNLEEYNNTEATRVNGDSYYSQVALGENSFTLFICDMIKRLQKISPYLALVTYKILITMVFPCLDAKINFLSLTILGLRILFLKTIVFNVLMTLRLWMS